MSDQPKPRTTFSRDYVVQRIEARVASLGSKVATTRTALEELTVRQSKGDLAWAMALPQQLHAAEVAIMKKTAKLPEFSPERVVEVCNEVQKILHLLGSADRPVLNYTDRDRMQQVMHDINHHEQEVALLEHTLAYLRESPVTEFTVTSLQKLGLLEAVRFSLDLPDDNKRGRRR